MISNKNSEWRYFLSPAETWDAMYEECASAKRSIDMEQYIFENDEIGEKFLTLCIQKAREGVAVNLLLDQVGSASLLFSPLVTDLREAGGTLRFFNSPRLIDIIKPKRFFPRTHVKALVVDSLVFYIGGVCIAKRMEKWRDTHIRLTGPIAAFAEKALHRNQSTVVMPIAELQNKDNDFLYVQSDPEFFRHPIYREIIKAINEAKDYVYISAALFIPTRRLRNCLRRAVRRGVKVIVLAPEHSDVWVADWVGLSYAGWLMRRGVKLYHYLPSVLHNKITMVDGNWGTIGSCNMDPLSFFHNREANVLIKNRDALRQMESDFFNDLKQSREFTFKLLKEIPLWKRAAAHVARLMRTFL